MIQSLALPGVCGTALAPSGESIGRRGVTAAFARPDTAPAIALRSTGLKWLTESKTLCAFRDREYPPEACPAEGWSFPGALAPLPRPQSVGPEKPIFCQGPSQLNSKRERPSHRRAFKSIETGITSFPRQPCRTCGGNAPHARPCRSASVCQ